MILIYCPIYCRYTVVFKVNRQTKAQLIHKMAASIHTLISYLEENQCFHMTRLFSIGEHHRNKVTHRLPELQILKPVLQLNGCLSPPAGLLTFQTYQKYFQKGKCSAVFTGWYPPQWLSIVQWTILSPVSVTPETWLPRWLWNKSVRTL